MRSDIWRNIVLEDIIQVRKTTVHPKENENVLYKHYSFPAFDDNQAPVTEFGKTIRSSKFLVPARSILLNKLNMRFKRVWMITDETTETDICSTEFIPIIALEDQTFLYYLLTSDHFTDHMLGNQTGTSNSHQRVSESDILSYKFSIPLVPEQQAIANILSALDDKIETNNKINENLEKQAKAIFKSWFIDFEPFLDGEFVDSELGQIPKGWEVDEIQKYFDITIGRTPPRKQGHYFSKDASDMAWVSITDMGKGDIYIDETAERLTDSSFKDFNIRIIPSNTVIMSFKLTIGRVAITNRELTTNEAIAHFKEESNSFTEYLYLYLKQFNYNSLGNTSSIGRAINSTIVKKIPFLSPDEKTLRNFNLLVCSLFKKIRNLEQENRILSSLRDTLLPKLMSGEIEVPVEVPID